MKKVKKQPMKRCPECKLMKPANEVYERACCYQAEINDDPNFMEVVCNDCEHEHAMDI